MKCTVICLLIALAGVNAKVGFGTGEQEYEYVNVRPGAHMFYWLYYTQADVARPEDRPLILWLQGGPGGSSTGYGNFEILGPLDLNLNPRPHSWANDFNLLLVDNPVGTGYSYVENLSLLTKDNEAISRDLMEVMRAFYRNHPQFKKTPFYIYGQSYGGKMAIKFARDMWEEQKKGTMVGNITGIAMGNSWISPIDSVMTWGPLLYMVSLVDTAGLDAINKAAQVTYDTYERGDYYQATVEWARTENVVISKTNGVDFYNFLTKKSRRNLLRGTTRSSQERLFDRLTYSKYYSKEAYNLDVLMNGPVKKALGIPSSVVWGRQSGPVFDAMYVDFMKPAIKDVEYVLNNTDIKVQVYNGNLDVIVDTPGQKLWVNELKWKNADKYRSAPRSPIWVDDILEGYKRVGGNLAFFWINVAGHSVPADNPAGSREFLREMTGV